MTKKQAIEKYGIAIPTDYNNYNKEEFREFDNMYLESFYNTFYEPEVKRIETKEMKEKIAIVLGGQAGAGKSSLVADVKQQFKDNGRRLVIIDDDQYRKFYPYAQEILQDCPEYYTDITATATNTITPKILKFASDNGYNFVFDGTMKNTRIVNTMKTWEDYNIYVHVMATCEDYNIYVHVMATCEERSLISTAIRNGELRKTINEGRLVSQKVHRDMYEGLPNTLDHIEQNEKGLVKEIKIFTRSNNPLYPREEYSSLNPNGKSSKEALENLREQDRIDFFDNAVKDDIECLNRLITNLSEKEKKEAEKIIAFIEKQKSVSDVSDDNDEQNR